MLGAMSVVGIQASAIDMRDIADKTYKAQGLYDVNLKATTGFSADDIAAIRETAEVAAVMGGYSFDVYADIGNELKPVRTYALPEPDGLNQISLLEGSLPEKDDECLVERSLLEEGGYAMGDRITLSLDDMEQYDDVFHNRVYTITGVVSSPLYISQDRGRTTLGTGQLSYYVYLRPEAYGLSVYTDVYVGMNGSQDMYNISDVYSAAADTWKELLEITGNNRVAILQAERRDAQAEIDQGWLDYTDSLNEADEKIAQGRSELERASVQLNQAKRTLNESQRELDSRVKSGQAEIEQKAQELQAGQDALDARLADLNSAQAEIEQARIKLNGDLAALQLLGEPDDSAELRELYDAVYGALALLDSKQSELDAGRTVLQAGQKELDNGRKELDKARNTLETERAGAQAKIDSGWKDYNKGLRDYDSGLAQLNSEEAEAQALLADAKVRLEDAQAQLDNAPEPEWFYFTRKDAAAYESYYQDTLRLQKLGYVFPMVFYLVAILVSLTSMSRMVEEHRTQIGIYKALGYRPAAVMFKYMFYALISSGLGGILGVVIGSMVFPRIIADAYGYLYDMPPVATPVPIGLAALAIMTAVAAVVAVTLATCAGAMRGEPAALMRPKAPKAGKRVLLERIPLIWNALGFISKVTVRNIFRYKRRFFMTVAGVAGCAALLLTAFGLRDSVGGVAAAQYGDIFIYDAKIYLKEITLPEQRSALDGLTPETRLYIREESVDVLPSGSESGAEAAGLSPSLIVPEDPAALADFIHLLAPSTGDAVPIPSDGILITEKLARALTLAPGDAVILKAGDKEASSTVAGLVENYVLHYIYMSPRHYAELFGQEPNLNSLLLQGTADDETLIKNDDVRAVVHTADMLSSLRESTDALGVVTIVLLILACALAFVVLFNLTNINITERLRELATIKVLGFQDTETAMYIYRENVAVTLMGIIIGLPAGVYLNKFVLTSVEIDLLKFPQVIAPLSFVLAVALSLIFALFVNAVMYRKLVAIDMVESLKSVE